MKWIALAVQTLILLMLLGLATLPFLNAQSILVKVVPLDPWDPYRGEYVRLSYPFSRLPDWNPQNGETVYVRLQPDSKGIYQAAEFLNQPPEGGVYLKGRVQWGQILYGIESFYVQKGMARRYENAAAQGSLYAVLQVNSSGTPRLQRLRVD
ncbi:GDYXXLXY domain-containing protein [Deinococcus cellulosilyticus]|uniref:GDYXXLXY domain-containing protein n=1 Tax=Deinococcus cellulosilyticus (strain DSM 18568 / NBRC 106333 / KACC 11606 / 5516J-15) TaxID=1223518 RepID=A0A511N7V9_DEIC1|nr:GDYXXLXY domain-containing protein [Deinococcus cellulosilyticus]GEM48923.1 hypothetical protein DC3_45580 [Deinococcus cellulosilyticus NBRC 106333 = KACC 11606]